MLRIVCAVAVAMCMMVPRIGVLVVFIGVLGLLILRSWTDPESGRRIVAYFSRRNPIVLSVSAFLAWILIACLWASDPGQGLQKGLILALVMLTSIVLISEAQHLTGEAAHQLAQGVLIGFLVGGAYTAIETISHEELSRIILTHFPFLDRGMSKHVTLRDGVAIRMSGAHMTRVSFEFALFLCPALLAALATTRGSARVLSLAAIAAFGLIVLSSSRSQTAQLAVLLIFVTLPVAYYFRDFTRQVLAAVFVLVLVLIVPIALALFASGLHKSPDLFTSARARIIIWDYTAKRVLENPVLGVGTYSTRFIHAAHIKNEPTWAKDLLVRPETRDHPHCVYLQVWYELGLIGAFLFGWMGLAILRGIKSSATQVQPFLLTHFAMTAVLIGPTYGMWQSWFQFSIAAAAVALAVCAAAYLSRRAAPADLPAEAV